jgi:hypothetical protein
LDHESVEREGVVPHHDTTDIANNLRDAAKKHTSHETPALPSNAEIDVHKADERKESDEDNVGGERRSITVQTVVDGAGVEIAGRVRAEGVLGADGHVVRHFDLVMGCKANGLYVQR